ncbi:MAG: TRAP transporter substrate-binding protein [Proteobacteria bacterium]|nr:TRAP transporter substrate-binding protein [Pseudomonadota bacterium]HQR04231.1 TRAP transporter substrate-binding protein [Rhodocyclaceae bacterium]
MQRRKFLAGAGALSAAALPVAARADGPLIRWRLASSFPKSLDTIFDAANTVAQHVAAATGGRFQIQVFAAGELVPGPGVFDAVREGTVQLGHTSSYYYVGKDPTFAFDTAVPFGLNSRQQTAWMMQGGGMALMRELFRDHGIVNIPCGNTGAQMGGWYRKEIRTLSDLKGLKLRIGGFAGQVMARLGVVPQQLPGSEIYPALEKGVIDAAEWVGPYDDEKLGFNKVARYYYFPGWWEGGPQLSLYINAQEWERLPRDYQAILECACLYAHADMQAAYDVKNPQALKRLILTGTQMRRFSDEIMQAAYKATTALYEETAARNPRFRKVYEPWRKFRNEQIAWFGIAERPFDNFMAVAGEPARK